MSTLKFEPNAFGGAVIDSVELPDNPDIFRELLSVTINQLKEQQIKVAWMNIPIEKSVLISTAVEAGFIYHHAGTDYLELTLSIDKTAYVPPYSTHYAGAGGVVLDDDNNLLVIVEKYRGNRSRFYKLPGGTLDQGEHISDGVRREVLEETGIETSFMYLTSFRHWHGYRYDKSDFYFVCRLKPLSHDIRIDEGEIEEALWMPVEDYLAGTDTHPYLKRIVESALNGRGLYREDLEGYGEPETHELLFVR